MDKWAIEEWLKWGIEDQDQMQVVSIAERAIAALKEITKFRCTWATPDAEGCTCAGCIARRALRMED